MTSTILVLVALLALPIPEPAGELPDEIAALGTLAGDEQHFLEVVRHFDLAQQALADGDLQLAQRYAGAGDPGQANRAKVQAYNRIQLVRLAYEELLRHHPNDAHALTYYGELLYDRLGEKMKAAEAWKTAATLDKGLSAPRNNLALFYCHDVGEYQQGLALLEQVLELESDNPDYLYNAAQIYLVHFPEVEKRYNWKRKRVFRTAMKFSKRAAELAPHDFHLQQDYAMNFFVGENMDVRVKWRQAAAACQRARAIAPQESDIFFTWLNEARVWIRQGNSKRAETCLREALRIWPDHRPAKNLLAKILEERRP